MEEKRLKGNSVGRGVRKNDDWMESLWDSLLLFQLCTNVCTHLHENSLNERH